MRLNHLHRGFTLIEVSIALVILSMIMLATVSSLRSFGNTQIKVEEVTARLGETRIVNSFLRESLEAAVPVPNSGQGQLYPQTSDQLAARFGTLFWGNAGQIIWAAPLIGGPTMGGLHAINLSLEQSRLVMRWQPFRRGQAWQNWNRIKPHVLAENVEAVSIEYRPNWFDGWINYWEPSDANPVAVRMNLKVDGRFWPELVVRLDDPKAKTK